MTFDLERHINGLFFQDGPAEIAILEKSNREFGTAVGKVLAHIQDDIFECGLNGTIRCVCDEGSTMELVALIEHLRALFKSPSTTWSMRTGCGFGKRARNSFCRA
jgi:hypothetical protein